ncbi:unnamed protein product [Phaeothamnion confervicola]
MHPCGANLEDIGQMLELMDRHRDRLVCIGEVGLDYSPRVLGDDPAAAERVKDVQRAVLKLQAEKARALGGLPLNVHSRSAGHHTVSLLQELGVEAAVLHAFDGRAVHAERGAQVRFMKERECVSLLSAGTVCFGRGRPEINGAHSCASVVPFLAHQHRILSNFTGWNCNQFLKVPFCPPIPLGRLLLQCATFCIAAGVQLSGDCQATSPEVTAAGDGFAGTGESISFVARSQFCCGWLLLWLRVLSSGRLRGDVK